MTYKQFKRWCSDRATDGRWSMQHAVASLDIIEKMRKLHWWKRKKKWKEIEPEVMKQIVEPVIQYYRKLGTDIPLPGE